MKRRLWYIGDGRYRVQIPGDLPSTFRVQQADEQEGIVFTLLWEEVPVINFRSRVRLICYLIRFAYTIRPEHLIPSELLADHNLAYEDGVWRDQWILPDRRESIAPAWNAKRPLDRKIRLEEGLATIAPTPGKRRKGLGAVLAGFLPKTPRTPKRAKLAETLPDKECVFVLKSGPEAEKAHLEQKRRFSDLQKG